MYELPLSTTAYVVTGYMVAGALGILAGGFLAVRATHLERVIGACLAGAALLLALVGSGVLPATLAMVATALAGFGAGLAGPSRDMLIKRASPPGATGRVYGTVYSGLDIGFALAAPVFGAILDRRPAGWRVLRRGLGAGPGHRFGLAGRAARGADGAAGDGMTCSESPGRPRAGRSADRAGHRHRLRRAGRELSGRARRLSRAREAASASSPAATKAARRSWPKRRASCRHGRACAS